MESDEYYNDLDLNETIDRYEDMLKSNELLYFDVHEFESIIDSYFDANNFSKALKAVTIAQKQHPSSLSLQVKQAHILVNKGMAIQALEILSSVEYIETTNNEINELKGTAYVLLGKIKEAEKEFDLAVSKTIDNKDEILYSIALSFEQINEFDLLIKYLLQAYSINPDNLSVIYDLAYAYERKNDFNKSLQYYNIYLDKDPFADNVWFNIGIVYCRINNYKKAIEAYDFAIAINNNLSTAYFNKANMQANLEKFDNAIETYKEFIELEKGNVLAYCYIGECYEKKGEWANAENYYLIALEIDTKFSDAWYGMGIISLFRKEYSKSLQYVKKAISIDKENPEYWYTLGQINKKIGNAENAYMAYNKATEFDPHDYESWLNSSEILLNTANINEAINMLNKAYEYTYDIALINYRLAALHFINKNIRTGNYYLKKALIINSSEINHFFRFYPRKKLTKNIKNIINQHIKTKKGSHNT